MLRALLLLASAVLIFAAVSMWLLLYPPLVADLAGARDRSREAQRVSIPVGSEALDGWWLPGRRATVVILAAGYARDHRRSWRHVEYLRRDGHGLLLVDLRSGRANRRAPATLGALESEDLRAVVDWAGRDARVAGRRIALFGESLAGAASLVVGAERSEVAAVIADGAFARSDWALEDRMTLEHRLPAWPVTPVVRALGHWLTGHDPGALDVTRALAARPELPVLLLHAEREDHLRHRHARALEGAAGPAAESWIIPGSGHNDGWSVARRDYELRVRAFLSEALAGAPLVTMERVEDPKPGGVARRVRTGLEALGESARGAIEKAAGR